MNLIKQLYTSNLQNRLILGFFIALCLTGIVAIGVGIRVINHNTEEEIERRVRQDMTVARIIYHDALDRLSFQIKHIALSAPLGTTVGDNDAIDAVNLRALIERVRRKGGYEGDMLMLVDAAGRAVFNPFNPAMTGRRLSYDRVLQQCLQEKTPRSATALVPREAVTVENPGLSPLPEGSRQAMVLRTAYPIVDRDDTLMGAVVGGILLSGDRLAGRIKQSLYGDRTHQGLDIGCAAIFQRDMRISMGIPAPEGAATSPVTAPTEVSDSVIGTGKDWIGQMQIGGTRYTSYFSPLYDMDHQVIGMLHTGLLEDRYRDRQRQTILIFLGITMVGMIVSVFIFFYLGSIIIKRISMLKGATEAMASGTLDYDLPPDVFSGFGIIDEAFNTLSHSLKERDDRLKKLFKELTRTERLASLGQIAAGVAHEINNPLGGILLYSNLVIEELPADSPARKNMKKIIYQSDRCKEIVQNLLDFARSPSDTMLPLSINEIITKTLSLVRDQSFFHGIEITTRLSDDLPDVRGDRSRLEQVFLNLFINAADAMKGGGQLTITTQLLTRKSDDFDRVVFETEKICLLTGTDMLKITVADTGPGIDKSHQSHIFEPFFTTKDPGQGTGLGLSIAYGIIQQHDGFIDMESEPGQGTTFVILLPAGAVTDRATDDT